MNAIAQLAEAIGRTIYTFSTSRARSKCSYGYNQENFNSKSTKMKYIKILDILAEIEVVRNSGCFLGTASSNVFHVVSLFRGNPYLSLLNVSSPAEF